jgi:hypothetical protein
MLKREVTIERRHPIGPASVTPGLSGGDGSVRKRLVAAIKGDYVNDDSVRSRVVRCPRQQQPDLPPLRRHR